LEASKKASLLDLSFLYQTKKLVLSKLHCHKWFLDCGLEKLLLFLVVYFTTQCKFHFFNFNAGAADDASLPNKRQTSSEYGFALLQK